MSFHKIIEEIIQQGIAEGKFDNLEGRGRRIDLTAYFNTPSEYRVGYSLLKSNKFLPEEVELLQDIGLLKEKVKGCADPAEWKKLTGELHERQMSLAILIERNRRRR